MGREKGYKCKSISSEERREALWNTIERLVECSGQLSPHRELESLELVDPSDLKTISYAFQIINIVFAKSQEFRRSLTFTHISHLLLRRLNLEQTGVTDSILFQMGNLCFNVLHHTPRESFTDELVNLPRNNLLELFIKNYFANFKAEWSEDTAFSWFTSIVGKLVDKSSNDFSFVLLFTEYLPSVDHRRLLLEALVHLADQVLRERSAHSLVFDMPAALVNKNPEIFGQPRESFNFRLKSTDMLTVVELLLSERDSTITASCIKLLVGVTFLGGYNAVVQHALSLTPRGKSLIRLLASLLAERHDEPELATNCIRLAANLVHANPGAQKQILDEQLLASFLSRTERHENDPHAKEVIVVFVRYMTEGNLEARKAISQLSVTDFIKQNASFMSKTEVW